VSSKKYAQPLHLEPRTSVQLSMALLLLHGLGLLVAMNLNLPIWAGMLLSAAILLNFYTTFSTHVMGRGKFAILSLVWEDEGEWKILMSDARQYIARLLPSSYVHTRLIVLNFRLENGGRRTSILLPDSLDKTTYRKLLVRMQMEANRDSRDPD